MLADTFQVTLDQLSGNMSEEEVEHLGPKGKHYFVKEYFPIDYHS
jgi:hypothetical protein